MKKCAFTLAEVLITLSIIGVVAAITLPPLIQHHNKVVWVNQLKKSVNTLENGFKLLLAEDGVDKLTDTSIWTDRSWCTSYDQCPEFYEGLKKYFNVSSIDLNGMPSGSRTANYDGTGFGPPPYLFFSTLISFSDGLWLNIFDLCNEEKTLSFLGSGSTYGVALIAVDINGGKKPNVWGKDIFLLVLKDDGRIVGTGSENVNGQIWSNPNHPGACVNHKTGLDCAARIIEEGWKMNY